MKNHSSKKRRQCGGFTLIELMVAMAITTVIFTVLITITSSATDTWSRSRSEVRSARQAKAAVEVMAKDFESFVSRSGNNFEWFNASTEQVDPVAVVRDGRNADTATKLTLLTAATDRYFGQVGDPGFDGGGDVSGVGYRLRFKDPVTGNEGSDAEAPTFVLYRLLVNPDEAFNDLLGIEFDQANPNASGLAQGFSNGGHDNNIENLDNFICENVHQLTLTFHVEVSDPNEPMRFVTLDSSSSSAYFSVTGRGLEVDGVLSGGQALSGNDLDLIKSGRLTAIEISLSVLTDAGIARMNARDGLTDKDYARNVFHYSRVVEVPQL